MAEIVLEREFKTDAKSLWGHITDIDKLPLWFGKHSGFCLVEADLDLSNTGPWFAKMENQDGKQMRVGGEVLSTSNLQVRFSWAWIQEDGSQGEKTLVEMKVRAVLDNRAIWTIKHSGFAETPVADRHKIGWSAAQENMEDILSSITSTSIEQKL